MYCRMCGNKTGDTDHYCQVCGTPTGYQEASGTAEETTDIKEEIVFNPPYESNSHFTEEPLSEGEEVSDLIEEEEDLKEFLSENEIDAQKTEETAKPDASKETEFTWNIYQFPSSKKTEEIVFNWNMADFNQPQPPKETEPTPTPFEEEFFQEIKEDSNRIKEQNIDRFFTFSRKNEEFQELLDKEYEKLNMRAEPEHGGKLHMEAGIREEVPQQEIHAETEVSSSEDELPAGEAVDETLEEFGPEIEEIAVAALDVEPETDDAAEAETESELEIEAELETEAEEETEAEAEAEAELETPPSESAPKAEHLSEMARARAQFFGEELIRDNESIKKNLVPEPDDIAGQESDDIAGQESMEETPELPESAEAVEEAAKEPGYLPEIYEAEPEEEIERRAENIVAPIAASNVEDDQEEEGKNKHGIGQILLIILAIILFVEIVILGIRFFAPESGASKVIGSTQTQIFKTLSGWSDGIKDLFSGNDSKEDEGTPDVEDSDQENPGQEAPSGEQPQDPVTEKPEPNPNPTADKNALVSSQMGNNSNIAQVKANEALAYQSGKNYGQADINNSKPITNNIWMVPDNGNPVYYDESLVGTVIAFDSQWIDYVNGGSKSVLELLKKDSEAYRKTLAFSKVGKVKETFKLLEIGEIRQGAKGFYVWVHEEIQITENGVTTDKKYNWIYYLEPVDGKMQIVNYFKF